MCSFRPWAFSPSSRSKTWAVASAYTSGGNAVDYLDRKGQ